MKSLQVASGGNFIRYSCGCIVEYQLAGVFQELGEWHTIPCPIHTRKELARQATKDWEVLTSEVRLIKDEENGENRS